MFTVDILRVTKYKDPTPFLVSFGCMQLLRLKLMIMIREMKMSAKLCYKNTFQTSLFAFLIFPCFRFVLCLPLHCSLVLTTISQFPSIHWDTYIWILSWMHAYYHVLTMTNCSICLKIRHDDTRRFTCKTFTLICHAKCITLFTGNA